MSYRFPDRDTLDALYGNSSDAVMVEQFESPLRTASASASENSNPAGNSTLVYTNGAFQELLAKRGLPASATVDNKALLAWLSGRLSDSFKSHWRQLAQQSINNLQLADYAADGVDAQRNAGLMISTTPITSNGYVYGCWTRITDATPAIDQAAQQRRTANKIDAFVRNENVPLVCLTFAEPLNEIVPAGELLQAYSLATISHASDSAAALFSNTPGELLNQQIGHINNPAITEFLNSAFPATNQSNRLALGETPELLVEINAHEPVLYRVKPTFVFDAGKAREVWIRIEDVTSLERQNRDRFAMEQTRSLALAAASLHQFEVDTNTYEIKLDRKTLSALALNNVPTNVAGWRDLLTPDNVNLSANEIDDLLSGKTKELNFIARLKNDRDEDRYIEIWGVLGAPAGSNMPGRALGLYRDVTASETLNARLSEKKTLEGLGVLAGGVAHDFNNLLMSVLGYAELMEADLLDMSVRNRTQQPENTLQNIHEIRTAALRASDLCTSLLAYAGQHLVEKSDLDLTELVRSNTDLAEITAGQRAPLTHNLHTEARIAADKGQLTQVIVNLVGNAADAMEGYEGSVHLSVTRELLTTAEQDALPEHVADPGVQFACLSVRDDGCGMTSDTQKRMYEPFFTTKAEGRGLGMAAVHGIVKNHGGAIMVRSAPGKGTEFRVYLPLLPPLAQSPATQATLASSSVARSTDRPTVLVVDDEDGVRVIAAEMLRHLNCDVHEADSAEAALALFAHHSFDHALVDITMPVMSGTELAELLFERVPQLNVVLCSGYAEKDVPEALLARCAFLHKPYTLKELAAMLQPETLGATQALPA